MFYRMVHTTWVFGSAFRRRNDLFAHMKIVLVSILLILNVFSCSHSAVESQFKISGPKLNEILLSAERAPTIERQEVQPDGSVRIYVDYEEKTKYLNSIGTSLEPLLNGLRKVALESPLDKWSDDILFMVIITDLQVSNPDEANQYTDKAIDNIEFFLEKYKKVEIEPWTRKEFGKSFFAEYEKSLAVLYPPSIKEREAIINDLKFFLAKQYEKKKDVNKALALLRTIEGKYVNSDIDRQIKFTIAHLENELHEGK